MKIINVKQTFPENLRYWLDIRDKTQNELSKGIGVSKSIVSDWLKGKKIPKSDKVVAMADFFSCDVYDLVGDPDDRQEPDKVDMAVYELQNNGDVYTLVERYMSLDSEQRKRLLEFSDFLTTKNPKA